MCSVSLREGLDPGETQVFRSDGGDAEEGRVKETDEASVETRGEPLGEVRNAREHSILIDRSAAAALRESS